MLLSGICRPLSRHYLVRGVRYSSSLLDNHDLFDTAQLEAERKMNINSYGDKVFMVNDKLVGQSILLLPRSLYLWKPRSFEEITVESLSLFTLVYPTIEVLFIGTVVVYISSQMHTRLILLSI